MPESFTEESSQRRNRSIRLAVITSFVSKFSTILLQLLSIPIAIRVLGRAEFGIFTTVNLTLSTMILLEVGIGPALTHGMSQAISNGDETRQRELGSTAFFLVAGISALAGLILGTVLLTVPLPTLFGSEFIGREAALRPALWTGLGIFVMLFLVNLTERMREGHLEVASNNLWGAVGNLMAAITVGVGIRFVPQVWFLVVAFNGAMLLAKVCNTVALWRKHPLVIPSLKYVRPAMAKHLFSDGIAFSTCCVVTGVVEYNFCGWMVGRTGGPAEVGLFGIFITLTVMQLGFVVMLSTPTWPAVAEALSRGDHAWARQAAKRLYLFGGGFAVCSAIGLTLVGPWVLPFWLGKDFSSIDRLLLACYCLYFIAHVWRHLNHAMMIGTGQVGKLLRIQLIESASVAILGALALHYSGIPALFATMGVVILSLTGTFLPKRVAGALKKRNDALPAIGS
ncbi:MAG: lipopolysaccharide biosynthesis protein [Luteolibacter sp.]|uniref:lipopolysaccharide biosynthesis protein n=1 Tax=Luteolibacter sp. TaxID=1962973 RepID=UPI003263B07D